MNHRSPEQPGMLHRRQLLRGIGVTVALPFLETIARAEEPSATQRFVCVANPFGMIHDAFFPSEDGLAAALPANLVPLEAFRGQFTVFSNLDHGFSNGHGATHTFLSGVLSSEAAGLPEGNVSLDQFLARHVAGQTRFPVLNTAAGPVGGGGVELSWTSTGVMVPPIQQVSQVFRLLFLDEPAGQLARRGRRYDEQASILDAVHQQAVSLAGRLSSRDRHKLDQYLTAIREVERSLAREQAWLSRPRPAVDMAEPPDGTVSQQLPILFDLVALALETDSTRIATIEIPGSFDTAAMGIEEKGYHGYSHHGKDPTLMAGMRKVEHYQLQQLARFLGRLRDFGLLNSTQVLFGSGMSDGSAHTNRNLPVLVAGGGCRHQTHVTMPAAAGRRVPLSNLYLTLAKRFGVAVDRFGPSTGGIEALA